MWKLCLVKVINRLALLPDKQSHECVSEIIYFVIFKRANAHFKAKESQSKLRYAKS